jgi:hypothetical protein
MKFIAGLGVSTMSGSQAGTTASRNANGAYFRNKSMPTNANSVSQQAARALFSAAAAFWKSLTAAQQASFKDQVINYPYVDSLGQTKTYTPSQLCMTVNNRIKQSNALQVGNGVSPAPLGAITTMPAPVSLIFPEDLTATFDVSAQSLGVLVGLSDALSQLPDGFTCIIDATTVMSNGKYRPKNPDFRNICRFDALTDSGFGDTAQVESFYFSVFTQPVALGDTLFVRATILADNGMYSNSIYTQVSVVA